MLMKTIQGKSKIPDQPGDRRSERHGGREREETSTR